MIHLPKKKFIHTPKKFKDNVKPNVHTFRVPTQEPLSREEMNIWLDITQAANSDKQRAELMEEYKELMNSFKWYEKQYFWFNLRTTTLAGYIARPEDSDGGASDDIPDDINNDTDSRDSIQLRVDSEEDLDTETPDKKDKEDI